MDENMIIESEPKLAMRTVALSLLGFSIASWGAIFMVINLIAA